MKGQHENTCNRCTIRLFFANIEHARRSVSLVVQEAVVNYELALTYVRTANVTFSSFLPTIGHTL